MAGIGIGLALPFYQYLGAQGGGEIGPPDFIATDAAVWLKADAGVTLNGSNVSAWADQSTHGNDATQANSANQPLFSASVAELNGQPAVTNLDDADVLDTGNYNQGDLPAGSEHFIVGTKPTVAPATNAFVTSGSGTNRQDFYFLANGI